MASAEGMESVPTRDTFYSNLNGTTSLEIVLIASVAPVCLLLRFSIVSALVCFYGIVVRPRQNLVVEFSILVLPCTLVVTLLNQHTIPVLVTLIVTSSTLLIILYSMCRQKPLGNNAHNANTKEELTLKSLWNLTHSNQKLQFVTAFRVYAMISTIICILAVDFVAFPRRLAKTETYGTGMMDLGVGAFTLANAVVSPEARGMFREIKGLGSGLKSIGKSLISAVPILALGFIRLASVKVTDYHEHVSEYGIHWNFFFTLATVSIFSSICLTLVSPHMSGLLSLVLAASYQNQLTNQGLGEFVLHGDDGQDTREGLLNANREGLVSCIGYLVIYLAGIQLGRFLFLPRSHIRDWVVLFLLLCVADAMLWGMLHFSVLSVEPVCRRSANLSYIIWILAYSVHLLASFLLIEIITTIVRHILWEHPSQPEQNDTSKQKRPVTEPHLISAIDYNLLLIFLLANLLTGAVNMSVNTIEHPPITGFVIVTGYMFVICVTALVLHRYKIRIKFW